MRPRANARPPRERRAFSLLELAAVVAILGLIAGMAVTRFGHDTLSVTDGAGFARKLSLAMSVTRRQAIAEGVSAAVVLNRTSGAVSGLTLVRANAVGDEPIDDPIAVPSGVTVTAGSDRWEFDFSGGLTAPAAGGVIRVDAPGWYWDVTTNAVTGHVRCERFANP